MTKRKIQSFTVRNTQGQFLGTYHALTAEMAIQKHKAADAATGSTFRKSQPAMRRPIDMNLTAKVES